MKTKFFTVAAEKLEFAISKALGDEKNYLEMPDFNNSSFTITVKSILTQTIRNFKKNEDYRIATSKIKDVHHGEWLYDFVCYQENEIGLTSILLVAEIEWHRSKKNYFNELRFDFEKLIQARSKYRLMIFEGNSLDEINTHIAKLNCLVKNFELSNLGKDRYMYAAWNCSTSSFYFDLSIP